MKPGKVRAPVLTQRMTLHLNGGHKFSELHYAILADGEETGISLHERTNGSPEYVYTARELHCGQETLDLMKPGPKIKEWIIARIPRPESEAAADREVSRAQG